MSLQTERELLSNYRPRFNGRANDPSLGSIFLGRVAYDEARRIQSTLVRQRISGEISDCLIFCEHPPTITLGRRSRTQDLLCPRAELEARGIDVRDVSRGGAVTYHGPGQLLIYPVISLPARGLGVKRFVELGLSTLSLALSDLGISSIINLEPAGVWVVPTDFEPSQHSLLAEGQKIAAVGLRIVRGVTDHGFSLNVDCDLENFSAISPCGHRSLVPTSISAQDSSRKVELEMLASVVYSAFQAALPKVRAADRKILGRN